MKQSEENIKTNGSAFQKFNTKQEPQKKEPYSEGCAAVFDISEKLKTKGKSRHIFSSFGSAIGDITIILNT